MRPPCAQTSGSTSKIEQPYGHIKASHPVEDISTPSVGSAPLRRVKLNIGACGREMTTRNTQFIFIFIFRTRYFRIFKREHQHGHRSTCTPNEVTKRERGGGGDLKLIICARINSKRQDARQPHAKTRTKTQRACQRKNEKTDGGTKLENDATRTNPHSTARESQEGY